MTHRLLEYKGEKDTCLGWSTRFKIAHSTLYNRIESGWTMEEALNTPINNAMAMGHKKGKTKNDAELYLNELKKEELPEAFKYIPLGTANKLGQFLRSKHRAVFDKWFMAEFSKQ